MADLRKFASQANSRHFFTGQKKSALEIQEAGSPDGIFFTADRSPRLGQTYMLKRTRKKMFL
jgi:hypothetical protein